MNDFKLMQLSWVYDLNYKASFRLLSERDYANRISETLPHAEKIQKAIMILKDYIYNDAIKSNTSKL